MATKKTPAQLILEKSRRKKEKEVKEAVAQKVLKDEMERMEWQQQEEAKKARASEEEE